jgi:hypothetical protein
VAELTSGPKFVDYVSAYVPDDMKTWIEARAAREDGDVNSSDVVRWLLRTAMEKAPEGMPETRKRQPVGEAWTSLVSSYIEPEVKEWVRKTARDEGVPMGSVLRWVIGAEILREAQPARRPRREVVG